MRDEEFSVVPFLRFGNGEAHLVSSLTRPFSISFTMAGNVRINGERTYPITNGFNGGTFDRRARAMIEVFRRFSNDWNGAQRERTNIIDFDSNLTESAVWMADELYKMYAYGWFSNPVSAMRAWDIGEALALLRSFRYAISRGNWPQACIDFIDLPRAAVVTPMAGGLARWDLLDNKEPAAYLFTFVNKYKLVRRKHPLACELCAALDMRSPWSHCAAVYADWLEENGKATQDDVAILRSGIHPLPWNFGLEDQS